MLTRPGPLNKAKPPAKVNWVSDGGTMPWRECARGRGALRQGIVPPSLTDYGDSRLLRPRPFGFRLSAFLRPSDFDLRISVRAGTLHQPPTPATPKPPQSYPNAVYKGCTPDAHGMHTLQTLVHLLCIRCIALYTARCHEEVPWTAAAGAAGVAGATGVVTFVAAVTSCSPGWVAAGSTTALNMLGRAFQPFLVWQVTINTLLPGARLAKPGGV